MKFEEYLAEQARDAEYRQAERDLKPYLDLANKVLALRLERGWSQAALAQRVGTKQANISRIENGQANPTLKLLHRLAATFESELTVDFGARPEEVQPSPEAGTKISIVVVSGDPTSRAPWQIDPPAWWPAAPASPRWRPAKIETPIPAGPDDLDRFAAA